MIFNPILKPDGEIEFGEFLKIIDKVNWYHRTNVLPKVFHILIPKSYSKIQDLFNLLNNSTEYMRKKRNGNLFRVINLILNQY